MKDLIDAIKLHGTKALGFIGITLATLAAADPALVGGERAIKYYLLAISILNVWRGYFTSDAFKVGLVVKQENTDKANAIIREGKQGGFARLQLVNWMGFTCCMLAFIGPAVLFSGCVSTQAAYRAAPLHGEAAVDTAYVIAEHYSAVLKEAADTRDAATVSPAVIRTLQETDRRVKPLILGNPETGAPGLRQLAELYTSTHDAKDEAQLQEAVNAAAIALADLINALKAARGK